jgi:hypothetical protein
MILGLDISTSITGVTILDYDGNVLVNEAWNFKNKTFFEKVKMADDKLAEIYSRSDIEIERVCIEQSLQAFRPGYSSAKTLLTLAKFNGILSWLVYETFGIEATYIAATSARKTCGIKVPKGQKAKQVVMQYMLDNEDWFVIEYTHHGNPKPEYFDRADSYIVAKAGLLLCQQNKSSES